MELQRPDLQWWKRQGTSFWAAATLGVPILLSGALLGLLLMQLIVDGGGAPAPGSRLLVVGVVELVLVAGSFWFAHKPSPWTTGAAVAGAITAVFVLAAAWVVA